MMQDTMIASADPEGNFKVNRRYRWIPDHTLKLIEAIENDHFENIVEDVSENGIYRRESTPQTAPRTIGFRKDAALRDGFESFRRKRGPGFKRQMRNTDVANNIVTRIENEIKTASVERLRGCDFDFHLIRDDLQANRLYDLIYDTLLSRRIGHTT